MLGYSKPCERVHVEHTAIVHSSTLAKLDFCGCSRVIRWTSGWSSPDRLPRARRWRRRAPSPTSTCSCAPTWSATACRWRTSPAGASSQVMDWGHPNPFSYPIFYSPARNPNPAQILVGYRLSLADLACWGQPTGILCWQKAFPAVFLLRTWRGSACTHRVTLAIGSG